MAQKAKQWEETFIKPATTANVTSGPASSSQKGTNVAGSTTKGAPVVTQPKGNAPPSANPPKTSTPPPTNPAKTNPAPAGIPARTWTPPPANPPKANTPPSANQPRTNTPPPSNLTKTDKQPLADPPKTSTLPPSNPTKTNKQPPADPPKTGTPPAGAPKDEASKNSADAPGASGGPPPGEDDFSWINTCEKCNGRDKVAHDANKCCIACRNYTLIDELAKKLAYPNLSQITGYKEDQLKDIKDILTQIVAAKINTDKAAVMDQVKYIAHSKAYADYEANESRQELKDATHTTADESKAQRNELDNLKNEENKLLKRCLEALAQLGGLKLDDPITLARFSFTWVAHSVRYNQGKLDDYLKAQKSQILNELQTLFDVKKYEDLVEDDLRFTSFQRPLVTLVNGFDVCRGYAALFQALINSQTQAIEAQCVTINGDKKGLTDTEPSSKTNHDWNAIPFQDPPKVCRVNALSSNHSHTNGAQIIDVTSGYGSAGRGGADDREFDSAWFTKSNWAFARTHYPKDPNQWYLGLGSIPPTFDDFWKKKRAQISKLAGRMMVDEASITPLLATIDWKNPNFSFKPICGHIVQSKIPGLAFWVRDAKNSKMPAEKDLIWPIYDKAKGTYEATIDLGTKFPDLNRVNLVSFSNIAPASSKTATKTVTPSLLPGVTEKTVNLKTMDPAIMVTWDKGSTS